MERDLRDIADGERSTQSVTHDRMERGLDEVSLPRWRGDRDATENDESARVEELVDVDRNALHACDQRPMQVYDDASRMGEGQGLSDPRRTQVPAPAGCVRIRAPSTRRRRRRANHRPR